MTNLSTTGIAAVVKPMNIPSTVPNEWRRGPFGRWFSAKPSRVAVTLLIELLSSLCLITLGVTLGTTPLLAGGGTAFILTLRQIMIFAAHARREIRG